ncbi:MAG: bifunctional hydroxymethylpyrimidine kinase/phosphomethylpyrimidine kinase [Clostridia bacterium]
MKKVLAIAGSDSSGGAGIQADIKSISASSAYALTVITAITAQNTLGVNLIEDVSAKMITEQLKAIRNDIKVDAIKIGMVSKEETIKAIAKELDEFRAKVVLDPVMVSKSNHLLLQKKAIESLVKDLFPKAYLITPNLMETYQLTGIKAENIEQMKKAAKELKKLGPKNVLVKGGHLEGEEATDLLLMDSSFYIFSEKIIDTNNNHGTGCTLSSAIAANIANEYNLVEAVGLAKTYITKALKSGFKIGQGVGVLDHFFSK